MNVSRYLPVAALFLAFAATTPAATPQWPQFRGPNAAGVSEGDKPPVQFGSGTNLLWKAELPGVSSPVVWGERVFLTAFEGGKLVTAGLDRRTGGILWKQAAPAEKIESTHKVGSPASATPATDGERVYSYFASYGVVAYDFAGREQWRKPLDIGVVVNGSGTSPALLKNRLVVNCDQQDGKSFVIALEPKTGKVLWQTPRPDFSSSYTTPMLWTHDGQEDVIIVGSVRTVAYGLEDGKERWSVTGTEGVSVAPTPVVAGNNLIVMSRAFGGAKIPTFPEFLTQNDKDNDSKISRAEAPGYLREHGGFVATDRDKDGHLSESEWNALRELIARGEHGIFAVRAPGRNDKGDLTASHVLWKHKKGVAAVASPLFYRGRVYAVQDGGRLSCYDGESGRILFEQERLEADGEYYASPIAANGYIYFGSNKGVTAVIQAGDTIAVKARNDLGEPIFGTPAIADDTLYVRTANHLWAFRKN